MCIRDRFPLFALGLYQLVNGGRGWLYAVGLFLLATSMYRDVYKRQDAALPPSLPVGAAA